MKSFFGNKRRTWAITALFAFFLIIYPVTIDIHAGVSQYVTHASGPSGPARTEIEENAKDAAGAKEPAWYEIGANMGIWIGNAMMSGASMITWLGGKIFDTTMNYAVVDFGTRVNGLGDALNDSWATIRDICNLAFIFGFIYIGIRTIIDPDSSTTKRFLSRIIIGALLINFSLYLTQVVIDFSNFTAVQIYNAIVPNNGTATISLVIAKYLGITSIFASPAPETLANLSGTGTFAFFLVASAFLVIAGFTLAAGGLLLLVRFVELLLIMVFSPILFAARVFPQTEDYANKMFRKLITSAFYAPAYLLLVYLSLALIDGLVGSQGKDLGGAINSVRDDGAGAFEVVINFIIIIALMIFALTLAQKMSVAGGQMAINVGNSARKGAQGYLGRGAVAVTGLGRAADSTAKTEESWRKSSNRLKQFGAIALSATGVASGARSIQKATFGSSLSRSDVEKQNKTLKKERLIDAESRKLRNTVATSVPLSAKAEAARFGGKPVSEEYAKAQIELQKAVLGASAAQLTALLEEFEKGSEEYTAIVKTMSHQQFEKLMEQKEEDMGDKKKDELKKARQGVITDKLVAAENKKRQKDGKEIITKLDDSESRALAEASIDELGMLDFEIIKARAGILTAAQIDEMKKDKKKYAEIQIQQLEEARKAYFTGITQIEDETERSERIAQEFNPKTRKAKDVVKLPQDILTNSAAKEHFTVDILQSMFSEKIDRSIQQQIMANLGNLDAATLKTSNPGLYGYLAGPRLQSEFEAELRAFKQDKSSKSSSG